MREWVYTHEQITGILKEQKIGLQETKQEMQYARITGACSAASFPTSP